MKIYELDKKTRQEVIKLCFSYSKLCLRQEVLLSAKSGIKFKNLIICEFFENSVFTLVSVNFSFLFSPNMIGNYYNYNKM